MKRAFVPGGSRQGSLLYFPFLPNRRCSDRRAPPNPQHSTTRRNYECTPLQLYFDECWNTETLECPQYYWRRHLLSQRLGTLRQKTFPGPPNYEDVHKGDKNETLWLLKPDSPTCVAQD